MKPGRRFGLSAVQKSEVWRRSFATRLVHSGVDIVTVQHLLGHANISMTVRYVHSPDKTKIEAVRRLDELLCSQSDPNQSQKPFAAPEISAGSPNKPTR
jgi:hypothetical protein